MERFGRRAWRHSIGNGPLLKPQVFNSVEHSGHVDPWALLLHDFGTVVRHLRILGGTR